jgi:hypothetical protein
MWQLLSRICGWKSEAGSIKAPAIPSPNGPSRLNNALHRTLDSAGELWRCYDCRCQESRREVLTCAYSIFCVIGRAGASKTRRLLRLLSGDWRPPSLGPSGTGLGLGTRVSCRRFTPTRVVPHRGCVSSDQRVQPGFPLRARASLIRYLRREGNFLGNSPHKADQFSRNRHHNLVGVLATRHEVSIPFAQADLRLPTEVLDGFGQVF